jgi:Tol biopolymer transport system component
MKMHLLRFGFRTVMLTSAFLVACGGGQSGPEIGDLDGPEAMRIVFVSNRDGNDEIYMVNGDGGGLSRLTENAGMDQMPAWSPDGRLIAFVSDRDAAVGTTPATRDVYVMNADGSGQRRLTQNSRNNVHPVWSPDGSRVAYVSQYRIHVIRADGSGETQVSPWDASLAIPVWSPDGLRIAAWTAASGGSLYVVNSDGSSPQVLAHSGFPAGPIWSPDGSRILFGCDADVCIIDSDGSDLVRLPVQAQYWAKPLWWSKDGLTLAFSAFKTGKIVAYVMNVDGSGLEQLPDIDLTDASLLYGAAVRAFPSVVGGNIVYLLNADGSDRILADDIESDTPVWSPDGSLIASSVSTASGGGYLFIRSPDGSGRTTVIPRGESPAWSPVRQ